MKRAEDFVEVAELAVDDEQHGKLERTWRRVVNGKTVGTLAVHVDTTGTRVDPDGKPSPVQIRVRGDVPRVLIAAIVQDLKRTLADIGATVHGVTETRTPTEDRN